MRRGVPVAGIQGYGLWPGIPAFAGMSGVLLEASTPPLARARLGAARRRGGKRIVGPGMARVAALHLGFDRGVAAAPEAGEIARHLHRPMRRRQQLDHERHPPRRDGGMAVEAEQLLHADRKLGPLL